MSYKFSRRLQTILTGNWTPRQVGPGDCWQYLGPNGQEFYLVDEGQKNFGEYIILGFGRGMSERKRALELPFMPSEFLTSSANSMF